MRTLLYDSNPGLGCWVGRAVSGRLPPRPVRPMPRPPGFFGLELAAKAAALSGTARACGVGGAGCMGSRVASATICNQQEPKHGPRIQTLPPG